MNARAVYEVLAIPVCVKIESDAIVVIGSGVV